jgi:RNA polymerase II-associated protein 1
LVLDLIKNLSAAPRGPFTHSKVVSIGNVTNTVVTASDRINSVLGVSLIAGPGHVSMLEKAFDILFESSILKCLRSSIKDFVSKELQQSFKFDISAYV